MNLKYKENMGVMCPYFWEVPPLPRPDSYRDIAWYAIASQQTTANK